MTGFTARMSKFLAAGAVLSGLAVPAFAGSAEVDATYSATLAGLPIGTGSLGYSLKGDDYRASLDARISGFGKLFTSRVAKAESEGKFGADRANARTYSLDIQGGGIPNYVRMAMANGAVTGIDASEVRLPGWDNRVPLTPAHKKGVIDPLAGFMIKVDAGKDPFAKDNCQRVQQVFDGRVRYDLRLVYGATSEVKGSSGSYAGKALICAVGYKPIAGFRHLTEEERKFEESIEFSIWFVPVGDTGVMLPHRVLVGTPVGLLIVKADRFMIRADGGDITASIPTKK